MTRSFRVQLGLRGAAVMALSLGAISVVSVLALARLLDYEIDATVLSVATIQAASLTDSPTGEMHFHDWELTPDEAASVQDLVRYAQVWRSDGVSLLRSQYMTSDLPLDAATLDRAATGELVWTNGRFDGVPVRILYYPLERLGAAHERHVLQVAAPIRRRHALVGRVAVFMALLTLGVTSVAFLGSRWLAGRAIRPVREIMDQAESVGASSLDRRIHAYADTDEYRRLVEVLNTMLARIESAFATQRRFAADASHELRSPLTVMRGELELALRRERDTAEYRRVLDSTLEEVIRLSRITEDLLLLARSDSGALDARTEALEIGGVVRHVVERMAGRAETKGVSIEVESMGDLQAEADPVLLGQVVWNLLDNAISYAPSGGHVSIRADGTADVIRLSVRDSGPGFPDEAIDQVFRRFYRADQARAHTDESGTGLGLAIVRAVAEAHGGHAVAYNVAGGGALVEVTFPRRAPHHSGA